MSKKTQKNSHSNSRSLLRAHYMPGLCSVLQTLSDTTFRTLGAVRAKSLLLVRFQFCLLLPCRRPRSVTAHAWQKHLPKPWVNTLPWDSFICVTSRNERQSSSALTELIWLARPVAFPSSGLHVCPSRSCALARRGDTPAREGPFLGQGCTRAALPC